MKLELFACFKFVFVFYFEQWKCCNMDRLAIFVWRGKFTRKMSIYTSIHLSVRLLHGFIVEKRFVRVPTGKDRWDKIAVKLKWKLQFISPQAQLEAEIEALSFKIERADTNRRDRGDIENQMDVAEKRRLILLKDFFPTFNNNNNNSICIASNSSDSS